jgi:hypothetical protein
MGLIDELRNVANPNRQASEPTETALRTNPFTGPIAGISDAVAFSEDEEIDNPLIDEDSTADAVFDTVWEGHGGDTVDVRGPALFGTEGSVADVVVQREGETRSAAETKTTLLIYAVIAGVALFLLAPLIELVTEIVAQ